MNSGSLNCSLHAPMYSKGQEMLDANCLPAQFCANIENHPLNTKWTNKNHLYQYSIGFHREDSKSVVFPSLDDKKTSLDPCFWPSYKLHDKTDLAKLSGTWSSFLPVVAVRAAHFLFQLQMAPLLSFYPYSFPSHLPPPGLPAILPKIKVKTNKRLFLKIFCFLKRQIKIKPQAPKSWGGSWTETESLNI